MNMVYNIWGGINDIIEENARPPVHDAIAQYTEDKYTEDNIEKDISAMISWLLVERALNQD